MQNFIKKLEDLNLFLIEKDGDLILRGRTGKLDAKDVAKIKNDESIIGFIKENKSALLDFIAEENNKPTISKLSPLQEGMLFHGLYDADSKAYTEQAVFELGEGLNIPAFRAAWDFVVSNHSILRSSFIYDQLKVPVQCAFKKVKLPFDILDFTAYDADQQEAELIAFKEADLLRGFDFKEAPLMRLTLIQLADEQYKLIWTFHHILLDGWSIPVVLEELLESYEFFIKDVTPPAQKEDRYDDFIKHINAKDKFEERRFWESYLEGFEEPTILPFIKNQADRNTGSGTIQESSLVFDKKYTDKIKDFAQKNRVTVNTIVQATWARLLSHYAGQKDAVFGVTVSGRPAELENAEQRVGLYINTLPFRAKINDGQWISDWLAEIQEGHTQAREYQHTALTDVQKWNKLPGNMFDSLIVFENYPVGEVLENEWSLKIGKIDIKEQTNYLLSLLVDYGDTLAINFSYNESLLEASYIERIQEHFKNVLTQIVDEVKGFVSELDLMSQKEKDLVLNDFNQTNSSYPDKQTVAALFEAQVKKTPKGIAVTFEGKSLTYRELNEQANQLANYLQANGVTTDTMVGLCMDRSMSMIVAILAILKAGGVYVPLDANYPQERIEFLLKNADIQTVVGNLTERCIFENEETIQFITLDELATTISAQPITKPIANSNDNSLIYVMYTSGSTGKPKGVLVKNKAVARLVFNESLDFLSKETVTYQYAPVAFDASTFEIWGALLKGGKLVVSSPGQQSLEDLAAELKAEKVNTLWLTAGLFHMAVDNEMAIFEGLDYILSGGDTVRPESVRKILEANENLTFVNGYGPTESTTFATTNRIDKPEDVNTEIDKIGYPIGNTKAYVLDPESTGLVAVECWGELCLSGPGLAKGYLGQATLTAQKFIPNPYDGGDHSRLYRTGDLVRWMPDGSLAFGGRIDNQVKVRGYRIELGEIQNVLQQSPEVQACVVLAKADAMGSKQLVAYVVENEHFDKELTTAFLKSQLPEYMVPTIFVELPELPLNANGKVDRKALPDPNLSELNDTVYVAPSNETEIALAAIWSDLLKVENVGINDNFFDLGGHSLLATRLTSTINKELSMHIPIKVIFEHPSIAELYKYMRVMQLVESATDHEQEYEVIEL